MNKFDRDVQPAVWLQKPKQHTPQQFLNKTPQQPLKPVIQDYAIARAQMVTQLRATGTDERVLQAMNIVPRHRFVDSAFALRSYEVTTALSIGYQQSISQPLIVAHMLSLAFEKQQNPAICLEIGTGCGYQVAVMAQLAPLVCSIERINGLYLRAKNTLQTLSIDNVQLYHGDGTLGWQQALPIETPSFDAIVVAAAGLDISNNWLLQLNIGARLVAPVQVDATTQQLCIVERTGQDSWVKSMHEKVQFVPLIKGTR